MVKFKVNKAEADWNCAFNSFALGLLDLINQNKLKLDLEKQQIFMSVLSDPSNLEILSKRRRDNLVEAGRLKVADHLQEAVNAIKNSMKGDFSSFVDYVRANSSTSEQVTALSLVMVPALRQIGVSLYNESMIAATNKSNNKDTFVISQINDANNLFRDATSAGMEALAPLAKQFFRVNVRFYDAQTHQRKPYRSSITTLEESTDVENPSSSEVIPEVNLLYRTSPDHWDFLEHVSEDSSDEDDSEYFIVKSDKDKAVTIQAATVVSAGKVDVATVAKKPAVTSATMTIEQAEVSLSKPAVAAKPVVNAVVYPVSDTSDMIAFENEQAKLFQSNPADISTRLQEVQEMIDAVNNHLIVSNLDGKAAALNEHVDASSSIVDSARKHLIAETVKTSAYAALNQSQKDVLLGNVDKKAENIFSDEATRSQVESDAKFARALQNAEIMGFFAESNRRKRLAAKTKRSAGKMPAFASDAMEFKKPKVK